MDQAGNAGGNMRRQNGALALLALLCLVLSVFAWRQEPLRDANIEPARWDERDYWLQPVERNAHLRLQSVQAHLNGVAALENGDLIAVGRGGAMLQSGDQGAHWQAIASNTQANLHAVISLPGDRLLAVGDDGKLLYSADRGRTWRRQASDERDVLTAVTSVEVAGSTLLLAVGINGTVLRSTDQGVSWQRINKKTSKSLFAISAVGEGRIAAAGSDGMLLLSEDRGQTWQVQNTGSDATFLAVTNLPGGRILLGGTSGVILHSADQGKNWQIRNTGVKNDIHAVLSLQNRQIVAVGEAGTVLLSTDQGETWQTKIRYTKQNLNGLIRFPNGAIVAIGNYGTVLKSADHGQTWQARTGAIENWEMPLLSLPNGRIIIGGAPGCILISIDRGQTWQARKVADNIGQIDSILGLAEGRILAKGSNSKSWVSSDQGETWQITPETGGSRITSIDLSNIHIYDQVSLGRVSPDIAQPVGKEVTAIISFNALQTNWANGPLIRPGVDGKLEVSNDKGNTWQAKATATKGALNAINTAPNGRALVVGEAGTVLLSADQGETWHNKVSGSKETLWAVRSLPNDRFIAVGEAGTLLLSTDQGETWQSKTTATKARLSSITNLDDGRIVVAATNGEILFSDDQGETWQAITFRRYPARWYWCALALLLLPTVWLLRRKPHPLPTDGLNEQQASDAPELDPRQDRLGHRQIVQGVAAFMRNDDTRMPLTLAVTGAWGLGKSSLMGFLKADLAAQGFRCVWFNPWHYQKEEHILAALLEQVQQSAVPPLLSASGLRFRLALLIKRIGQRPVKSALLLTLALAGMLALQTQGDSLRDALGYIVSGPPAANQPAPDKAGADATASASAPTPASAPASAAAQARTHTSAPAASAHASAPAVASAPASASAAASAPAQATSAKTSPAPRPDLLERAAKVVISTFFNQSEDRESAANAFLAKLLAASLALLSALPLLLAGAHAMRAFSVKASILFTSIDGWLGVKRAKAQTSFRASFATEFRQVTEALAPVRLAIFIDDLDRCKPDVVMEIMEAINFLSVSGDCFVVLGIATDKVAHAIGLSQKDIASQLEPGLPPDQARLKYGNMYLRKLVNIEIPVGSLNNDKVSNLLVPPAPPPDNQPPLPPDQARRDNSMTLALNGLQALTALLWRGVQGALWLFLPVLLLWGVANLPHWKTPSAPVPAAPAPVSAPAAPEPTPTPTPVSTPTPTPKPETQPTEPPREVYIRPSGDPTPPFAVNLAPAVFLLLLLAVALRTWLHGLQQRMQDTSEFKLACKNWAPVIGLLLDSSREVKRWQNRVRYINARLRLIVPPPAYWQRAKLATQARRAQWWPRALLGALITSLRLPAPVVTQALPEAQLVALCALMSVASRFDCTPALQQAASQTRTLADIAADLPAQLPPNDPQQAHYQQIKLVIAQAIQQIGNANLQPPATNDPPIAAAVLQQFLEIANQFEISEKAV